MNINDMRIHVEQLAHGMGINVTWNESLYHGSADAINPSIDIPRIRDDSQYAIALHELGHKATRSVKQFANMLEFGLDRYQAEVDAWTWAKSVAIKWTAAMEATKMDGLSSYEPLRRDPMLGVLELYLQRNR